MKKFIATLLLLITSPVWAAHGVFSGTAGQGARVTCDGGMGFIWLDDSNGQWGNATVSLEMEHPSVGAAEDWRPVLQGGSPKTWDVDYMENVNTVAGSSYRLTFAGGTGTSIDWVLNCP